MILAKLGGAVWGQFIRAEWFKLIGISGDKWLLRQIESFGSRLVDLSLVSASFSRVLDI